MTNLIDIVLPVLIMGILIFSIKAIGGALEKPVKKLFGIKSEEQIAENRKEEFDKIFPVKAEKLPLEHLRRDDRITLSDGRTYVYYSFNMERHSLWQGQEEVLLSNDELTSRAIRLKNRDGIKWTKPD